MIELPLKQRSLSNQHCFFSEKGRPPCDQGGQRPPVSPSGTQRPAETSSLRGQTWPLVDLAVLGLSYSYWEQTLLIDFVH